MNDERERLIPEDAVCRGCGYALRGLTGRVCPECGVGFDTAKRTSFRLGKEAIDHWAKLKAFVLVALCYVAGCFVLFGAMGGSSGVRYREAWLLGPVGMFRDLRMGVAFGVPSMALVVAGVWGYWIAPKRGAMWLLLGLVVLWQFGGCFRVVIGSSV